MGVGAGALALAVRVGFGFLINVLFHCILTAVLYYADSRYHGLVVNRAKPLESLYCEAAAENLPEQKFDTKL